MPDTPEGTLIPVEAVRLALGLPETGEDAELDLAIAAATAYVVRYKGELEAWPADYRLGAVRLTVGLYRDANKKGIAEPFGQGNVMKRATDVEIEQLLRIGRFAVPQIG